MLFHIRKLSQDLYTQHTNTSVADDKMFKRRREEKVPLKDPMGPAPTILNMCPDNNEVTYMWRKKTDDSYDPNVGPGGKP